MNTYRDVRFLLKAIAFLAPVFALYVILYLYLIFIESYHIFTSALGDQKQQKQIYRIVQSLLQLSPLLSATLNI